jgi:hypothetical protein
MPGPRYLLGFINEIRKIPASFPSKRRHTGRSIFGVLGGVVGIDGHELHPFGLKFPGQPAQRITDMDHKRAVITDKHHDGGFLRSQVPQA